MGEINKKKEEDKIEKSITNLCVKKTLTTKQNFIFKSLNDTFFL